MSKIALSGNASGTGTLTIAAPNTDTDRTLDLPDAAGTIQVSGNPISGTTGSFSGDLSFNSGYGSAAVAYGCRAWVNFDGTGTPAIRSSGNVSSITDNGTGDYTVNFTTAMPDANYSTVKTVHLSGNVLVVRGGNISASAANVYVTNTLNTQVDPAEVFVAIFR
jgi:uncharacterized protein (AIM24 family)